MNRILRRMLLLCLALMFAVPGVYAEGTATDLSVETIPPMEAAPVQDEEPMAEDITRECLLNGSTKMKQLWDGRHMTFWESTPKTGGVHRLIITPPEGKAIGGVSIRWRSHPVPVKVQVAQGEDWRTVAETDGLMYSEYIPLDGLTCEIRVVGRESEKTQLRIDEVRVVTPGRLPEDLQVWQLPGAKVDMILLSAHPDDEVLWFGGMIPTYAAEQKKDVLVVCAATWHYNRRQELLDSLWTMGVRIHPVFLGLEDVIGSYADKVFEAWNKEQVLDRIAGLYRTYQPDVVVLHDVNGEYGHGVHKAISRAGRRRSIWQQIRSTRRRAPKACARGMCPKPTFTCGQKTRFSWIGTSRLLRLMA